MGRRSFLFGKMLVAFGVLVCGILIGGNTKKVRAAPQIGSKITIGDGINKFLYTGLSSGNYYLYQYDYIYGGSMTFEEANSSVLEQFRNSYNIPTRLTLRNLTIYEASSTGTEPATALNNGVDIREGIYINLSYDTLYWLGSYCSSYQEQVGWGDTGYYGWTVSNNRVKGVLVATHHSNRNSNWGICPVVLVPKIEIDNGSTNIQNLLPITIVQRFKTDTTQPPTTISALTQTSATTYLPNQATTQNLPTTTKYGYSFIGLDTTPSTIEEYTDSEGKTQYRVKANQDEDISLVYNYVRNHSKLCFDLGYENKFLTPRDIWQGSRYDTVAKLTDLTETTNVDLPIPTRKGWTFKGWYDGNKQVADKQGKLVKDSNDQYPKID